MADNTPVLGQNPIDPINLNAPTTTGGADYSYSPPKNDLKSRLAAIQAMDAGRLPAREVNLPISSQKFNKRLGEYAQVEGVNLSEDLAQDQSGAEQIAYFIPRAASKAITETLKIPGFIGGTINWAAERFDPAEYGNSFNNGWNIALDRFNQNLQENAMPVYTPQSVQDGNIWDKLSSTSFWATEGADGVGFLAGMMVPGAVLRWGKLGERAVKAFTAAEKLSKPADMLATGLGVEQTAASAATAARINDWTAAIVNTGFEALTEGVQANNEYLEQNPGDIEGAGRVGRNVFLANNAILIGPNILNQKWLFNGFKRAEGAVNSAGKAGIASAIDKTVTKAGELAAFKAPTTGEKIWNISKVLGKGVVSEGFFEEGLQYAAAEGAKKGVNVLNPVELLKEYAEDISADTKGNTEMWSGIIIGSILGGGMSTYGGVQQQKQETKLASEYNKLLSTNWLSYLKTQKDYAKVDEDGKPIFKDGSYELDPSKVVKGGEQAIKNVYLREMAKASFEQGNKEGYDNILNIMHFDYMLPWLQIEGGIDLLKRHIKTLAKTENDKELETLGIETKNVAEIEKELVAKADKFQAMWNRVNDTHKLAFNVTPVEGSTKTDIDDFSNIVKHAKLSSKVIMDFKENRINELTKELSTLGVTATSEKFNKEYVNELKKSYEDLKATGNIDTVKELDIDKKINSIEKSIKAYLKADQELKDAYDNEKNQKAFKEYMLEKAKVTAKKDSSDKEDKKEKATKKAYIKDPLLQKVYDENVKIEKFDHVNKNIKIWDEESQSTIDIPGEAKLVTTRGLIKIKYKDSDNKEHSIIAAVGEGNTYGALTIYITKKNDKGKLVIDDKKTTVAFLNSNTELAMRTDPQSNKITTFKDVVIENYKSPEELQMERQIEAFTTHYKSKIEGYESKLASKNEIVKLTTQVKDLKSELRTLTKEHRKDLALAEKLQNKTIALNKEQTVRIMSIYKTVNKLKNKIQEKEEALNKLKNHNANSNEKIKEFKAEIRALKDSGTLPFDDIKTLLDEADEAFQMESKFVATTEEAIVNSKKLITNTLIKMRVYRSQLSKALNLDISDSALNIQGLPTDEKNDIVDSYLMQKISEIMSDPYQTYLAETAGADIDRAYTLSLQLQDVKEWVDSYEDMLQIQESNLKRHEELLEQSKEDLRIYKYRQNEIFKIYRKLIPDYFKKKDIYNESLVNGKLLEGDLVIDMESFYPEAFKLGNWEVDARHPYEDFDSFLTITSNQEHADKNADVMRWFVFVNNFAYKGLEKREKPKYALRTFTFKQISESTDKKLKSSVKFYLGDGNYMSHDEIMKIESKAEKQKAIDKASNDIKAIIVNYAKPEEISLFTEDGVEEDKFNKGTHYIYSSVGLGTEVYNESGYDRFSSKKWKTEWAKEKLKEDPDISKEDLEALAQAAYEGDFEEKKVEFLKFRERLDIGHETLAITGINRGVKVDSETESDLADTTLDELDYGNLKFYTSAPIVNKETGQYKKEEKDINGNNYQLTSGFTYWLKGNNLELVKPKTLGETKSEDAIFNIFKAIAQEKENSEQARIYLEQALHMLYSSMSDTSKPHRLFFHKSRDKKGEVIEGKYDRIIYGDKTIDMAVLAEGSNETEIKEFKDFLATKYWNFDRRLIDNNVKDFIEWRADKKGDLFPVTWKAYGGKDTKGKEIKGPGVGGYQAFLFQPNEKGDYANVTKGKVNLAPAVKQKGVDKYKLSVLDPQYINQSLRTTIKKEKVVKTKKEIVKKDDGIIVPEGMRLFEVTFNKKKGYVVYNTEKQSLILNSRKDKSVVFPGQVLTSKQEDELIVIEFIKSKIKNNKVAELNSIKVPKTEHVITLTEVSTNESESTSRPKLFQKVKEEEASEVEPKDTSVLRSENLSLDEVWEAIPEDLQKTYLDSARAESIETDIKADGKVLLLRAKVLAKADIIAHDESTNEVPDESNEPPFAKLKEDNLDDYVKEGQDKIDWFKEKFPNFPIELVPQLIDGDKWGKFVGGTKVLISELAEEGTTYHEAFHVWNVLFNDEDSRKALYNEVKTRLGNDKLTDRDAEEFLAEEFRDYMMMGSTYKFNKNETQKKSFFEKIIDWIKKIFGVDVLNDTKGQIEEAFEKINKGTFITPTTKSKESFNKKIPGISATKKLAYLKDVNYRFFSSLLDDVSKDGDLIFDFEQTGHQIYNRIFESYSKDKVVAILKKQKVPTYVEDILKNKDLFIDNHLIYLTKYGISLSKKLQLVSKPSIDNLMEDLDEDAAGTNKAEWIESNKVSLKDTMPSAIRLLIAALKDTNEKGAPVESEFFTRSNIEYDKIVNLLHNNLSKITTPEGIMSKLKYLAKSNPSLKTLHTLLGGNMSADHMSMTKFKLYEQFVTSFSSNKMEALLSTNNNDGTITKADMVDESRKEVTKLQWIQKAKSIDSKYIDYKDGDYYINKSVLAEDIDKKVKFDKILEGLGIAIPEEMNSHKVVKDYFKRLRQSLVSTSFDITVDDLYNRDRVEMQTEVDNLAKELKDFTGNDADLMYYNIDGHMEWSITRSSHLSDVTNKLNEYADLVKYAKKNKEPIPDVPAELQRLMPYIDDQGIGNLFNGNSQFWNHISNGNKIRLVALKGLKSQMGDGAEVSDLKIPDYYYMTFDAILNNIIPFRRAADRGMEYGFQTVPTNPSIGPTTFADTTVDYLYDEVVTSVALLVEQKFNRINNTKSKQFGSFLKNYSENAKTLRTFDFIFNDKFNEGHPVQSLEAFVNKSSLEDLNMAKIRSLASAWIKKNDKAITASINNFIKQSIEANKRALIKNGLIKQKGDKWSIPGLNPLTIKELKLGSSINNDGLLSNTALNQLLLIHAYNFFVGVQEQHKMYIGDMAAYDNMKSSNKRTTSSASTREKTPNDDKTLKLLNDKLRKVNKQPHSKVIKQVILSNIEDSASEELQKISSLYKDMKIADGSVLCTLDFMRGMYGRRGLWTDDMERTYQYEMQSLVYRIITNYELHKLAPWANSQMFTDPDGIFYTHTKGYVDGIPRFNGAIIDPLAKEMGALPPMKTQGSGYVANNVNIGAMVIDKMAVEPMIPSLLKDNELKFLLNMLTNDIDSVSDETTKKADRYVNQGSIKDGYKIDDNTLVTEISYDDYGFQFDIEDKDETKVTDSSQKICVYTNNMYNRGEILPEFKELEPLIHERDNLLNEVYSKSLNKAKSELGLVDDKDSNFYKISDIKVFKDKLIELFIQRQLPDNIIDGLDLVLNSKTKLFDLFSDGNKVEQVLLAYLRNNVLKRKVNGAMLVQVPSYIYSEDLKFYTVADGSIQKAEVMIPIPKKWNKWVKSIGGIDKLNEMLAAGKLDEKITEFTANRIPTADINTIEIFKIKKFLPSYVGSRIVLPKEIVAKTSSDFDVDKLTSYFNNLEIDNKKGPSYIEYEKGKDNTIEQIENRINEIHEIVLTHPARFKYLLRPHSADALKELSKKVRKPEDYLSKLEKEHGNEFWLSTQYWYNNMKAESFWGGKKVLAIAASANTVNSIEQRYPIEILHPSYHDIFFFEDKAKETNKSGLRLDSDNKDTSDNHAQVMVAAVDVAKDDFISELNINTNTLGVALMLQKYAGVSMKSITKMLTHPVVSEYLKEVEIASSQFMKHNQYTFVDRNWYWNEKMSSSDIVKRVLSIGDNEYERLMSSDTKYYYSTKVKYKNLSDSDFNKNDKKTRIQILDNYLMYVELAWKVNALNSSLRPYAASKFGKSLNSISGKIEKTNDLIEDGIFSATDITEHIKNTFLNGAFETYEEAISIYGGMYLTTKYPKLKRLLSEKIFSQFKVRKTEEYDKAVQAVQNNLLSFMFTFHGEGLYDKNFNIGSRYKELFIGKNSIPKRLREIKDKVSNEALEALSPIVEEYSINLGRSRENDYIRLVDKKLDISDQNLYTSALEELLSSKDKEVVEFAEDLIEYSIYQNGIGNTPISYTKILPNSVFIPLMDRLTDNFMKKHEKDLDVYIESFYHQLMRNRWHDNNLVYRFEKPISDNGKENVDLVKEHGFIKNVNVKSKAGRYEYLSVRYYKTSRLDRSKDRKFGKKSPVETLLYKKTGRVFGNNFEYELVEKLGDGYMFTEFYPVKNGNDIQSVLTTNRYEGIVKSKEVVKDKVKPKPSTDDFDKLKSKLYQLDEKEQGEPIEELDNIVKDYLNAIGVTYKAIDVIKDHTGSNVPAIAVAKLSEMSLEVIEGKRNIKTLPEEAAHFYVSLLNENDPLYKSMFTNIVNYQVYRDVVKDYTDRYKGDEKLLRHEAIGKLIADRMLNGINTSLTERQQNQVNTWWSKLWSHIKDLLNMSKTDPYAKAAYDILTKNTSKDINNTEEIINEVKKITPENSWEELPFTAKGIYKYDYRRNINEAELAYEGYVEEFGEENVTYINTSDPTYKVKIAIKRPKVLTVTEEVIKKEDAAIENMKELAKAPIPFSAEQLTINFDEYFEGEEYLEPEEKAAQMRAIEDGDIEISCKF